jgi:hypothetical protein
MNSQRASQNSKAKTVETLAERRLVPLDHSPPGYATSISADFRGSPTCLFRTQLFPVDGAIFPRFLRLLRSAA